MKSRRCPLRCRLHRPRGGDWASLPARGAGATDRSLTLLTFYCHWLTIFLTWLCDWHTLLFSPNGIEDRAIVAVELKHAAAGAALVAAQL